MNIFLRHPFNPFTAMWPTGGSHFAFHILNSKYVLLKNNIYHKMQREKLYNPHSKPYFNWIMFVFKGNKTLRIQFSRLRNDHLFLHECEISFFLFHLFIVNMISQEKTKYTTRCSVKRSTIYIIKLIPIMYKLRRKTL